MIKILMLTNFFMAKEAYYFSHDLGARNDPKLQKVLMKLGQEGKGVYWDLVEMLFEEGGKLLLSECESYAFALRSNKECITSLINDFDLFKKDRKYFWSDSVNKRIKERDDKSNKARSSAKSRWENANASKLDANALQQQVNRNAIKEKKVKEKKEEDIKEPPSAFDVAFKKFLEMRVKIRKPASERAVELLHDKLEKLAPGNEKLKIEIVEQSTLNCWQDVFPIKQQFTNVNSAGNAENIKYSEVTKRTNSSHDF